MKTPKAGAGVIKTFFVSAALLLSITGTAKLYSATGTAKILFLQDPILHINNRVLLLSLGLLEVAIGLYALSHRNRGNDLRLAFLLCWLSGNFIGYRVAVTLLGVTTCPCLGTLGAKLPLPHKAIEAILIAIVLYWFLGSIAIIAVNTSRDRSTRVVTNSDEVAGHA